MGYVTDFSIIIGIILLILSFKSKYKNYRLSLLSLGIVLLVAGFYFFDYQAFWEGFKAGRAAGQSMILSTPN